MTSVTATTVTQGPANFIRHYASQYCSNCQYDHNDLSQHLASDHLDTILNGSVRSAFSQHQHPAFDKSRYKYYDPVVDSDYTENQTWKQVKDGYDQANILEWAVQACPTSKIQHYLPQLIPPTLLILDDYDITYKIRGVHILQEIINKISDEGNVPSPSATTTKTTSSQSSAVLGRGGVDNVLIDTLFKCLTYLSDDSHHPLLRAAYPCLMDLICKTKPARSKERAQLFEKIMVNGILLGLKLGNYTVTLREILLEQLSRVYLELGVLGVQYLKVTIAALCDALTVPAVQLNRVALKSLQTLIHVCWPRIPGCHGIIIKGLATSWKYYYSDGNSSGKNSATNQQEQEMCNLIKETFKVYRSACKGTENADLDALLLYNRSLYAPLVGQQDISL
ncbi:hypothetical protein BDB00DRAFT_826436 [Zychaea mexicana]|uniref:uncharacterized protein n=1 Tax=Zychaea mexicana TaxID=64656 RepID=UPI0022FE1895|nr:uncharacterized protein BDB00DRAFT_826436 [Zychaea mexicana]KAI9492788.1 hypothetical protein BDB00DRAFT_826436 [Zychaea mexicana]